MGEFDDLLDNQYGRYMLIRNHSAKQPSNLRGVTLIELMVGLAVLGGLLAMAAPFAGQMISNAKIRTAAESILSGLQLARSSAVTQNSQVHFELPNGANSSWVVCVTTTTCADPVATIIQSRTAAEGTSIVAVAPNVTTLVFNGFGALTPATLAALPAATATTAKTANICVGLAGVGLTSAYSSASERRLKVVVETGGTVRLCDPALAYPDPQACLLSPTATDPQPC